MALTPQTSAGRRLGSFELVKEVSASSVGATHVAKPTAGTALVTITKIHRHVAKSPQLCDAFLAEAKKASALSHANIARVLESGTIDGEPYISTEHTEGETLASLLRRAGPEGLPVDVAARIVLDIIAAVEAAHSAEPALGHGELGPWCIHVGGDGITRVSGFAVDRALTRFGLHFAKNLDRLPYAAPERVKAMSLTLGPAPAAPDRRSDAFSVALVAWELFTRQRLFASRMEAAVIQKVLAGAIPDPKSQRAEIPELVATALTKCLTRDPVERATLSELASAIEAGEVRSHGGVQDFASQLVEKSQTRPVSSASSTTAFASVRPPPPRAAEAVKANGHTSPSPGAVAPAKRSAPPPPPRAATRAKTLMGFSPPPVPADMSSLLEEETTAELPPKQEASPAPPPAQAAKPAEPVTIVDDPTTLDSVNLVEVEDAAPARPPARRPPPKPRQHTLIGVEPVAESAAPEADPPVAPSEELREQPTKVDTNKSKPLAAAFGVDRLGPGAIVGNGAERYQLLNAVAHGGMATVWAARPVGTRGIQNLFAVKTILPELSDDPDFETMFVDEMRVASRIHHPNVAKIHSVGADTGVMFITMEWVDGETVYAVQQAARTAGGIPMNVLVRMAMDMCAGLHAAHELRDESGALLELVHRDVTPANVIVSRAGVSKVVDFGIAKSKGRLHVTRAGSTVKGKTPYLSPEQLGGLSIDRRSDLFSLGALLYTLATGVHPFRGDSELKTIENIVLKVAAPPRSIVPSIHPEFEKLVLRLLEKEPKKRFESAAAVQKELETIDALFDRKAAHSDVADFVERVCGDVFAERDKQLIEALRSFDPEDPAVAAMDAAKAEGPAGLLVNPFSDPAPQSPLIRSDEASTFELPKPPPVPADAAPLADSTRADEIEVESPGPGPLAEAATEGAHSDGADAIALAPPEPLPRFESEPPAPLEQRSMSPWLRLVVLVVVGVVVGILVIALIESMRKSDETAPSATVSAAPPPKTVAPAPLPAPTETALAKPPEPVVTAEPTATATAEPTAEPTAAPAPTETAKPPVTTARPPGTLPRPPGTVIKKPPIKKHNPTGI